MLDALLARNLLPDPLLRAGIRRLLRRRSSSEARGGVEGRMERLEAFLAEMDRGPIALSVEAANEQHYEAPTGFFQRVLGPRLKYSSCLFPGGGETLAEAEELMLELTCRRAGLADGRKILELGCGWGSLTLWMAEKYPRARITAVSNSRTQKAHIDAECARRGLGNVDVITCDMNRFEPPAELSGAFDHVISVEMFEHMRNWRALLARTSKWIKPDGRLFIHIFTHRESAYPFVAEDESDWMARHFFTGGMMPSDGLLARCQDDFLLERQWRVNGRHYARTAKLWLANMDAHLPEISRLFSETYGAAHVRRWIAWWRIFFMACEELWAFDGGNEWLVSHYCLRPRCG
jgi:cyclopropane-fatty-acyl-phospholipid synthase